MDAFKAAELARMQAGGNKPWRIFWEGHEDTLAEGRSWEDSTIRERYEGGVGEEWKARLSAKVEGREYVLGEEKVGLPEKKVVRSATMPTASEGFGSAGPGRTASPARRAAGAGGAALGSMALGKKQQNETYFAKKGAENASRPDDLHPNQGGKFAGFGSDWTPPTRNEPAALPGADEFQRDPLGALTKGFGWFGGIVQKNVSDVTQKVCLLAVYLAKGMGS